MGLKVKTKAECIASVIEWPTTNHVAWDKLTQWRYHDSDNVKTPSEAKGPDAKPRTVIEIQSLDADGSEEVNGR